MCVIYLTWTRFFLFLFSYFLKIIPHWFFFWKIVLRLSYFFFLGCLLNFILRLCKDVVCQVVQLLSQKLQLGCLLFGLKVLLRRKFLSLFLSFFHINLFYRFKIIQIAKNLNLTCVRGLEIWNNWETLTWALQINCKLSGGYKNSLFIKFFYNVK